LRALFGLRAIALMLAIALTVQVVCAGSATWNVNPANNDWNTAANWTPATVPNAPSDVATFNSSSVNSIFITTDTALNQITFDFNASPYVINVSNLTFNSGILNNSHVTQTFVVSGRLRFDGSSAADNVEIHNLGASTSGGQAGTTEFASFTQLSEANIINEGGTGPGAAGGSTLIDGQHTGFYTFATLTANGGSNGGLGGTVIFTSTGFLGEPCRLIANPGGTFDFSEIGNSNETAIGSLEGTGDIFLSNNGYPVVAYAGNGLSTTFFGVIHDGKNPLVGGVLGRRSTGSPAKTLSLANANTYSGGTIITGDILEARHEGALGRGDVTLQHMISDGTLTLQGAATNDYISDTATLNVSQSSVVNLNYTGTEAVGFLVVNGISQSVGLYGGPSSGAPHIVPQFHGTGTILVTQPSADSAKVHGITAYNVSLPFNRPYAVECRSGGSSNAYEINVGFGVNVTCNSVIITSGNGTVTGVTAGGSSVIITLRDVISPQTLMLKLAMNYGGIAIGSVFVPMNVVVGDVTGDGEVSASDVIQTKSNSGKALSATNFRSDVNVSGQINAGDIALVKSKSGTGLLPVTNTDLR
jgi:hypothetical protein